MTRLNICHVADLPKGCSQTSINPHKDKLGEARQAAEITGVGHKTMNTSPGDAIQHCKLQPTTGITAEGNNPVLTKLERSQALLGGFVIKFALY